MRGGLLLSLLLFLAACSVPTIRIDGRYDPAVDATASDAGTEPDAGSTDAAALDAGSRDAAITPDGGTADAGCVVATPPTPAAWVPADSGGPAGETVSACLARSGSRTDARLPEDQGYDLTTFGGGADTQSVSCGGPDADGTWYYAANAQRFSCGTHVRLVNPARTTCVIVQVADLGPNLCVEAAGERPIWDVSPLAAMALLGGSGFGWSDHEAIFGAPVGNANPLGPCDYLDTPSAFLDGFIGGPCRTNADCAFTGGLCRTEANGFPGGYCTLPCATGSCPDAAGPNAFTGCADLVGDGAFCAARCDYTLFAETGCRAGYGCETRPHPTNPALAARRVCLPLACR